MISQYTWPNFRGGEDKDGVRTLMEEKGFQNDVQYGKTKIFIRSPKTLFALEKVLSFKNHNSIFYNLSLLLIFYFVSLFLFFFHFHFAFFVLNWKFKKKIEIHERKGILFIWNKINFSFLGSQWSYSGNCYFIAKTMARLFRQKTLQENEGCSHYYEILSTLQTLCLYQRFVKDI